MSISEVSIVEAAPGAVALSIPFVSTWADPVDHYAATASAARLA